MKIFFKIFLSLFFLLFIAVIGFTLTFEPNDYKDDIIKLVKDNTGRTLSIPGDISLSLFPWIGIDLGAIEISNAKGFGKQPFAKMEHLQVRAKLWPLFKQKLEADTIVIEGLRLNLAKNKKGVSNWDDLNRPSTQEQVNKTAVETKAEPVKPQNILAAIALNGIKVSNAQFNWHDQQLNQKINVHDIQLSLGKLRPETKIPLKLQFHLKEKSLNATVSFKSDILISSNFEQVSLYDTALSSETKLAALKRTLSPRINSALMQLNTKAQTFETQQLTIAENTVNVISKIKVKQLFTQPFINGQVSIKPLNPRAVAKSFSVTLPEMSDNTALTKFNALVNIKGHAKDINVSNLELSLDETKLVGHARIKPMPASSSVNLVIDQVNLDRYLPKPVATTEGKQDTKTKNNLPEAVLIPVALLSVVNADAKLSIKKIQAKNTHWKNLKVTARSKNGHVQIKPMTLQGYDATIKTSFNIKAIKNSAVLNGKLDIQNIKAGKLLNDLMNKDKLKGQTTVVADFSSKGVKLSQLKQNLNGKLKLKLKEGTLKGFDLNHKQRVLEAKLKRQPIPEAPVPAETKIANLTATAVIKNGVLTNKDLRAATPLSRIAGQGTVNIVKEQLNYTASVKFTSAKNIKANKSYEKMDAVPLNIYVRGSFDKPDIKVDFAKTLKLLLKKELKKQTNAAKKKLTDEKKDKLKKKLENKLKDLFKF